MGKSRLTEITLNESPLLWIGCERNEHGLGFLFNPRNYFVKDSSISLGLKRTGTPAPHGVILCRVESCLNSPGSKADRHTWDPYPGANLQKQLHRSMSQLFTSFSAEGRKTSQKSRAGKIWTSCKTHFFHGLKNISDFTLIIERIVEWFHWWIICWPKKDHSGFWFPLSSLLYNIQQTLHPITQKGGLM